METSAPGVPKGPVPRLVPHKSLAERAYDILEEAIVTLELVAQPDHADRCVHWRVPGERLHQRTVIDASLLPRGS